MGTTLLNLAPEDFVSVLAQKSQQWKQSAGSSAAGRRHVRNLKRRLIRRYKAIHGITSLPSGTGTAYGAGPVVVETSPEDAVVVFLPQQDADGGNDMLHDHVTISDGTATALESSIPNQSFDDLPQISRRDTRRQLRRVLHKAIVTDSHAEFDLINAVNARHKVEPAVSRRRQGERVRLRGVLFEALGAAVLPSLDASTRQSLEAQGAQVIDNTQVLFSKPEASPLSRAPDFWHRRILPKGGQRPQPFTGKGVSIGIMDTGIDPDHAEFAHHRTIVYREFNALGIEQPGTTARDFGDHGTHVSAICAGKDAGIAPDAHLSVAAVLTQLNGNGQLVGYLAQVLGALNWLIDRAGQNGEGVDIINASLGFRHLDRREISRFYDDISTARLQGVVLVAAIGNEGHAGPGNHGFPAKFEHVIGVGAIDEQYRIARFSDWGKAYGKDRWRGQAKPDIVAPGVDVQSARAGGGYVAMSGSSMAAPVVAGALALILEARRELAGHPDRLIDSLASFTEYKLHWDQDDRLKVGRGSVILENLALTS